MGCPRVEVEIVDAAEVDDRRPRRIQAARSGTRAGVGDAGPLDGQRVSYSGHRRSVRLGRHYRSDSRPGRHADVAGVALHSECRPALWRSARHDAANGGQHRARLHRGSDPVFGDAFDVVWKANQKNVALLKRHVLATPAEERRARLGDWLVLAGLVVALALVLVGAITGPFGSGRRSSTRRLAKRATSSPSRAASSHLGPHFGFARIGLQQPLPIRPGGFNMPPDRYSRGNGEDLTMAVLLQIQNAHKSYGDQVLLDGAEATIVDDVKVGFVGRNGAGKITCCAC